MRRARPKGRWRDGLIAPSDGDGREGGGRREGGAIVLCTTHTIISEP